MRFWTWACITNDKALRAECNDAGVKLQWGLEPMLSLVAAGLLDISEAESVAVRIHETNPAFVTRAIVTRFTNRLRRLAAERTPENP
jgi:hypothetical protein